MQDSNTFGQWLRLRRRTLDLTQGELARQLGYSERTIRKLEADELRPSKELAARLAHELDITPDERELFVRYARGTALHGDTDHPTFDYSISSPWLQASPAANPPSTNLPLQLTSFVGRERELTIVSQLLGSTRLLTLTGVGGVGKTRLAIEAAQDLLNKFPDGIWMVELAPLVESRLVLQSVMGALRLPEVSGDPFPVLVDYLHDKQFLLILDNCEHLIEACAELADALLRACPDLQLLAISREPLGVAGETSWTVPPLSLENVQAGFENEPPCQSEAEHLFVERARVHMPTFNVTPRNASTVSVICRRLDGMPLAIELAAARVKGLELEQIATRLDDSFQFLTGGHRTAVPRQRTLRATIDWSYALLSESERVVLRRLPIFAGGWTVEAAEQVCGIRGLAPDEILDLLLRLVDKSLVTAESAGQAKRYRLLETIRQYAAEKLRDSGEIEAVRDSHLDYMLSLAVQAEPNLKRPNQNLWLERLENERDNLRAAWEWAIDRNPEKALRLSQALLEYWMRRGYTNEALEKTGRLVARTQAWGVSVRRAEVFWIAGRVALRDYDYSTARAMMDESLAIARAVGSKRDLAIALRGVGVAARGQGDHETAHKFLDEALVLLRELGEDWFAANALQGKAVMVGEEGDFSLAQKLGEEAIELFRKAGDIPSIVYALNTIGMAAAEQDEHERAAAYYIEALEIAREYGNVYQMGVVTWCLALAYLNLGDAHKARVLLEESIDHGRKQGSKGANSSRLIGMAGVIAALGEPERAARLLGAGEAGVESTNFQCDPVVRIENERIRAAIRGRLDDATFKEAIAAGRALTLEQAIALAAERTPA